MGAIISTIDNSESPWTGITFELHDVMENQGWDTTEAVFANPSPQTISVTARGDFGEDPFWKRNQRELKSFVAKSPNGDVVRVTLERDSISVNRYGDRPAGESATGIIEFGIAHYLGMCVMIAFQAIDDYVDRNGLGPVVNEVKRRRWAITLGLAIFAAII